MKRFCFFIFSVISITAFSNSKPIAQKDSVGNKVTNNAPADKMCDFNGGQKALYKFLGKNIKYPAKAADDGVQGRVFVQFTVKKDGSLDNFRILRGVRADLDNEALRVAKLMPNWISGTKNGNPQTLNLPYL
jgi:TonB family protein